MIRVGILDYSNRVGWDEEIEGYNLRLKEVEVSYIKKNDFKIMNKQDILLIAGLECLSHPERLLLENIISNSSKLFRIFNISHSLKILEFEDKYRGKALESKSLNLKDDDICDLASLLITYKTLSRLKFESF